MPIGELSPESDDRGLVTTGRARAAQLIEYRDVAQFGRALRSGRRSRKFESCHLDHKAKRNGSSVPFSFSIGAFIWLGCCLATTASSHFPLVDRQARLSGEERGNHGVKGSYLVISTIKVKERGLIPLSFYVSWVHQYSVRHSSVIVTLTVVSVPPRRTVSVTVSPTRRSNVISVA